MKVAMDMCGWDLGKADVLRKIIGRKEVTKINEITNEFIEDAVKNGEIREVATKVAEQIKAAGNYVFNRCLSGRETIQMYYGGKPKTIEHLFEIQGEYRNLATGKSMNKQGHIIGNSVVSISFSGVKDVYKTTLENGMSVITTLNHKFPTKDGIRKLSELSKGDLLYVSYDMYEYEKVSMSRIVSIEYECTENCYDVEMGAPNHNFLTGSGIVVCNCHAVSYAAVSYITAYLKTYYPKEYLCAILNSKDKQEDILPYIAELKRLKIPVLPPDLSIGNRKWTIEDNGIRVGLEYIKGVGKNLNTDSTETFESVVSTNTKTCVIPCIKAGALDYLGVSRAVLLAKFATTQDSLKRIQQCQEKIQQYTGDPKKQKLLEQWREKLKEAQEITQVTPEKYDEAAGEYEVLSFSFQELSKVKTGEVTNVFTKNDKNGREMAWVTMSTPYGDFRCTVFADGWQKVSKVVVGETYKFVVNDKGILEELQMDGKVIKVNERRYKRIF